MSWVSYNANRDGEKTVDCTVRAIATVLDQSWDETYIGLCMQGYIMASMPSGNEVWGAYLHNKGWRRGMVEDACPECFTVRDFCERFPKGKFLLAISGHVVAVIDGNYFDTFDSGTCVPIYFWAEKKED